MDAFKTEAHARGEFDDLRMCGTCVHMAKRTLSTYATQRWRESESNTQYATRSTQHATEQHAIHSNYICTLIFVYFCTASESE